MATLGIVELFIFLLLKYYEDIDKERKAVFADVHFALFYTAIFNAFQSVLVAIVTTRASSQLWIRTEHLQLDHYVEIREEFDRVKSLYQEESGWGIRFQYPNLRARYSELLVQVRFHELRIQFLEGNDLPFDLKVSEYLKRSEQSVLIHLVHVSALAWLLLTGGLNLIYFLMGMVAYITEDLSIVGDSLVWIFFTTMIAFILICLALLVKMRRIFQSILYVCLVCTFPMLLMLFSHSVEPAFLTLDLQFNGQRQHQPTRFRRAQARS